MMKNRRLGKFRISIKFIDDYPNTVKDIMGHCIIVSAEMRWESDSIHYTAISDWFDEVDNGCMPYEYRIVTTKNKPIQWMFDTGSWNEII